MSVVRTSTVASFSSFLDVYKKGMPISLSILSCSVLPRVNTVFSGIFTLKKERTLTDFADASWKMKHIVFGAMKYFVRNTFEEISRRMIVVPQLMFQTLLRNTHTPALMAQPVELINVTNEEGCGDGSDTNKTNS